MIETLTSQPEAESLIPFDVIPVQPDGGFLDFIRDTLARGAAPSVVRTTHTTHTTSRALT